MGRVTLFMHTSLDGFAAGVNGEMDWIHVDDEIFAHGAPRIEATEYALYGRKTFEMMEAYWPTAGDQPGASDHDVSHARWYKTAQKVVLSRTLATTGVPNRVVVADRLADNITQIKGATDREILLFGSPGAGHALMALGLIDAYWFNVNPVVLGAGIPVFANVKARQNLVLESSKTFASGVVSLSFATRTDS